MKNKATAFLNKYPFLKKWTNPLILVSSAFILWLAFFDSYSLLQHIDISKDINKLKTNKDYYSSEIAKDQQRIKELKRSYEVEKYAREKYFMKRENEDIYIIDLSNDSLSQDKEK